MIDENINIVHSLQELRDVQSSQPDKRTKLRSFAFTNDRQFNANITYNTYFVNILLNNRNFLELNVNIHKISNTLAFEHYSLNHS